MDYRKESSTNYFLYDTPIENLFISEYMPSAPEGFVKVYLLAIMHVQMDLPADNLVLAKELSTSVTQIDKAWDYWEDQGLVTKVYKNPSDPLAYEIEFKRLREIAFAGSKKVSQAEKQLDDKVLSKLYRDIEVATGRVLEGKELTEVASWLADYSMTPEVILFGYKYCVNKNKSTRYSYVGSILKDWTAKGFKSVADIEESLSLNDLHYDLYKKVFKELGFNRRPTEPEKRMMNNWFDRLGVSVNDVIEACAKTTGISNPNLNYIDSILKSKQEGAKPNEQPASPLSKIEQYYANVRKVNEEKSNRIRNEVYSKAPALRGIMDKIKSANFNLATATLSRNSSVVTSEKQTLQKLIEEKTKLLKENGFDESALDPLYTCAKCKDTGLCDDGSRCNCFTGNLK